MMHTARRPSFVHVAALHCALVPLACATPDAGGSAAAVRDSAGIRIVENALPTEDTCVVAPTPELDLGVVEGPPASQLFRVTDAATLSDGRVAVVNQGSGQIRIFSADGAFESAFGSRGEGPGEFRNVFRIWPMPGDTLVVLDYRPYRFSTFTADGEFVRAVTPDPPYIENPNAIELMADGTFLIAFDDPVPPGDEGEWPERTQRLMYHAADGTLLDTLAVLPHGRHGWLVRDMGYIGTPVFEASSQVAASGHRVVLGRGREREVESFAWPVAETMRTGSVPDMSRPETLIRWTGRDRAVRPEHVDAYRRALRERYPDPDPRFQRVLDARVSDSRPIAERFPPHATLVLGLAGDLWVHLYQRPREEEPGWLVFGPDGRFECRALLPFDAYLGLFEIGSEYILGRELDDLDVEHVRRYRLTRPSS